MKYTFTTLAINEPYFKKSLDFYIALHNQTLNGFFNITTTENDLIRLYDNIGLTLEELYLKYPRIQITTIENLNKRFTFPLEMEGYGFTFNLNLKVLSIKACLQSSQKFDYLIFCDGDWGIYDGFDEKKLFRMFEYMDENNVDFVYERPAKIGDYKLNNYENCFFLDKIYDYKVDTHNLWDEAQVVNEQFLAFRNNEKLVVFEQKWEQMLWYTIANNIRNYPDGFEIGVCALESKMKHDNSAHKILNNCFYFYPKYTDTKHIKF
jgi:hypothetical protein